MRLWTACILLLCPIFWVVVAGSPQQGGEFGGTGGRPVTNEDDSSAATGVDFQPPPGAGAPPGDLVTDEMHGASVKKPSPLHFPPRPPKTNHAIATLPTALTNGRDLLHVPSLGGAPLHFGSNQGVVREDGGGDDAPHGGVGEAGGGGGGRGVGQASVNFRTRVAPLCNNGSLALPCETDAEYTDEIAERVRQLLYASRLNDIIEDDTLSQILNDTAVVEPGKDFGIPSTRTGGFVVESPACRAQESIIYPQRAKTATDDWVFVVNQDSVKQGVRVEKCLREGEQCHLGADLPPTLRTTCRQKFIYRKLLVLGDTGTSIQPESVLLPSCCVCYIRRRGRRGRPEEHPLSKVLSTGVQRRQKSRSRTSRRSRNNR